VVTGVWWGHLRVIMPREKRCEGERGGDDGAQPFLKWHGGMGWWWGPALLGHTAEGVGGGVWLIFGWRQLASQQRPGAAGRGRGSIVVPRSQWETGEAVLLACQPGHSAGV
jgi:hypothetical protein